MAIERWRDIEGFPGYQVSDYGRVRSRWERGYRRGMGAPRQSRATLGSVWRVLPGKTRRKGYRQCELKQGPGCAVMSVHRMVAIAFIPNPRGLPLVLHGDGDSLNNRATNLRWGTEAENAADRERHGRTQRGATAGRAKLSEAAVAHIRATDVSVKGARIRLARLYGVSATTITYVLTGRIRRMG